MSENGIMSQLEAKHNHQKNDDIVKEAERDLEKLTKNTGGIQGYTQQKNQQVKDDDKVEIWGKKIGKTLGILFVIYLLYEIVQLAISS